MKQLKRLLVMLSIYWVAMLFVPYVAPEMPMLVTVEAATKVKLNKTKAYVTKGEAVQLKVSGTKKTVKWSSSDKKIATVSSNGKVIGLKKGMATITAKVNGKKYTCKVTVESPKISKSKVTVYNGKTVTLSMKNTKQTVKWTSSNKKVAIVNNKGVVKALKEGNVTIKAKVGSKKYTCKVTVKNYVKLESISLNKSKITLQEDKAYQLKVKYNPSNATVEKTVKWTSSNKNVARVDEDGRICALGIGTATITAKVGNKTATCKVTVKKNEKIIESGEYYGIKWSYDEDKTLILKGSCTKKNLDMSSGPWKGWAPYIQTVNVSITGVVDMAEMFGGNLNNRDSGWPDVGGLYFNSLRTVDFTGSNVKATDMSGMFAGCEWLEKVTFSGVDTSKVTDMSYMFYRCENGLESLDLSGFNTENVEDMSHMFHFCLVRKLNLSGFDTRKVKDMSGMFTNCLNLEEIDLSGLDLNEVRDMSCMFENCGSLKKIDFSKTTASKVEDMGCMFYGCLSLEEIDLSGFKTSNVTDMVKMFLKCWSLKTLNLSQFDTSNVTIMTAMFAECSSLTDVDVSTWDTSKVIGMGGMFRDCSSLKSLDLRTWDTGNVIEMDYMFCGCKNVNSIIVGNKWTTENASTYAMFVDCGISERELTVVQ